MALMRCRPLVNGDDARPSIAVLGPAPGARKRISYWTPLVSLGSTPSMRQAPAASVTTVFHRTLSRNSWTVQPCSARSPASLTVLKFASCQTAPPRIAAPGTLPTTIDALALAVCAGLLQETAPVLVTTVP